MAKYKEGDYITALWWPRSVGQVIEDSCHNRLRVYWLHPWRGPDTYLLEDEFHYEDRFAPLSEPEAMLRLLTLEESGTQND